jgi:predicted GNAT family N-acyltransferase
LIKAVIAKNKPQLDDALTVRHQVFVEEQKVPIELEIDEYEDKSTHVVLYDDEKPIGAGRFRVIDDVGKLERICVLPEYRGKGAGTMIIEKLESIAKEKGLKTVKLNAQTHAKAFYQRLGYETVSAVFPDAGIPHVTMVKTL